MAILGMTSCTTHDSAPSHSKSTKPISLPREFIQSLNDEQVSKDLEALVNAELPFAQKMLEQHGEFYPFAATISKDGEAAYLAANIGKENPKSAEMIEFVTAALHAQAQKGEYRAAAICTDIAITLPGTAQKTDAIRISFEHRKGSCLYFFIPYEKVKPGAITLGEAFASTFQPAEPIFVSEVK